MLLFYIENKCELFRKNGRFKFCFLTFQVDASLRPTAKELLDFFNENEDILHYRSLATYVPEVHIPLPQSNSQFEDVLIRRLGFNICFVIYLFIYFVFLKIK